MEGLVYASAFVYWSICVMLALLATVNARANPFVRAVTCVALLIVMSVPVLLVAGMWWMMGVFTHG